jgi:general secretion pathway protein I
MTVRTAGFSLIETLVALAILAAMAGVVYAAIGANARAAGSMRQRREAILLAQSLLAQATIAARPYRLGERGREGAMTWRATVRRAGQGARESGPALEEVAIEVRGSDGRRLAGVRTLRLDR